MTDPKADLHEYLRSARAAVLWKLEGLSEYDVRRPLVPTSTNLLGLVKHLAAWEGRRRRLEDVARGAGPAWAATPPASPHGTRSAVSGDCPPAPRRALLRSRSARGLGGSARWLDLHTVGHHADGHHGGSTSL